MLGWSLNDAGAASANVERVNAEPEISVENDGDERRRVAKNSKDEDHNDDSMNDEVAEHLRRVSLKMMSYKMTQ